MKPTVMPRKYGDSCVVLCETVRTFVHAVNQLFCTPPPPAPLLRSHMGNCSSYLQIDFCNSALSFRPLLWSSGAPRPHHLQQSSHSCGIAPRSLLHHVSSGLCFSAVCDTVERALGWMPGTWSFCPKSDSGPWKSRLTFFCLNPVLTRVEYSLG